MRVVVWSSWMSEFVVLVVLSFVAFVAVCVSFLFLFCFFRLVVAGRAVPGLRDVMVPRMMLLWFGPAVEYSMQKQCLVCLEIDVV